MGLRTFDGKFSNKFSPDTPTHDFSSSRRVHFLYTYIRKGILEAWIINFQVYEDRKCFRHRERGISIMLKTAKKNQLIQQDEN